MRREVIAIAATCVAMLVFAAQPALAIGVVPASPIGEANATIVQKIGQKGHHGHRYRQHHHHHHYYAYRHPYWPYYGYGYWPDYYYGGYAYRWGRPGLSIGFSF
jgi:hypothetical protein